MPTSQEVIFTIKALHSSDLDIISNTFVKMKVFCILAVFALAAAVSAFPNEAGREHGENGWYVPNADGSYTWLSTEESESLLAEHEEKEQSQTRLSLVPVNFYLYTSKNPSTAQQISETAKSILNSNFNADNPTKVLIHGWLQSYTASMNKNIRDAWLSRGDYNIIVVDWARARLLDYVSSVAAVEPTGKKVASMLDYLAQYHGLSMAKVEVIGHSLGAHVAGFTGKIYNKPNKRLNSDDATYVESIQTDGGQLGAFYPNGGKKQPGCGLDLTGACAHARSCVYYAEAVKENNFPSMRCGDYQEAVKKDCGTSYSSVKMGAMTNAYLVAGDYYVPVRSTAPYGMGS
ncbi:unnamed protein product [Ceratitis capitata]|uniref:(Mediterranean fruit fly) hypothetical protein n=1 Tax=Ceratitis capitata TaxID=7213 RepID=A0A811U764_CERCA|nr:unnamed protein product [Ceratitis capitata]